MSYYSVKSQTAVQLRKDFTRLLFDFEIVFWYFTKKLRCLIFQNLLLTGTRKNSCSRNRESSLKWVQGNFLFRKAVSCMTRARNFTLNKVFSILFLSFLVISVTFLLNSYILFHKSRVAGRRWSNIITNIIYALFLTEEKQ